jgi:menaquinone-dependent protoporphyrinogen IX oxidase
MGAQTMSKSILVVYGTKSGSTGEVAQFIGNTLLEVGAQVTVKSVESPGKIKASDAVFIGSPIINGKCMSEVKTFVGEYRPALSQKAVAFFITCLRLSQVAGDPLPDVPIFIDPIFGEPKTKNEMSFPERSHPITNYLKAIMKMAKDIDPAGISFFKGTLDYSKIGFFWTLFFKTMSRLDGLGPGDYRNWEAIRSWTEQTYTSL